MRRSLPRLAALGAALECGFAGLLATTPAPGRLVPYLVLYVPVFALYAAAVRIVLSEPDAAGDLRAGRGSPWRDPPTLLIVGAACVFRLTFLAAPPALSDDLYRYLWDGRVTLAGGNPYLQEPAPDGVSRIVRPGERDEFARIDHKEIPTIYPPGAQAVFAAGAALHLGVVGIKIPIVLADLLVVVLLRRILRARGLSGARALIYAWNPLAVTETAWSGHLEPLAIVFVLVAAGAIIQKREIRAILALALGGLVKIVPCALIVVFLRSVRTRWLGLVPLVLVAGYAPFAPAGGRVFSGLRQYADRWVANESLFGVIRGVLVWIDPTDRLKSVIAWARGIIPHSAPIDVLYAYVYPVDLAKGVCALLLLALAAGLWRRRTEPLRGCCLLTGAALLLSPTVHPWYVLWILPWLCLFPSRAFLLLSGLVALAYLGAPWARAVIYVPVYATLGLDWIRDRRAHAMSRPAVGRVLDF